jgi:hypothetical protein
MTEGSNLSIVPVAGRDGWKAFHELPFDIYRDDPNWIAPLRLERKFHFDPAHNPYFKHAEAAFWLAYRGSTPVGRISAQIDQLHLDRYQDATGHFGSLEAIDDPGVFAALLDAAEAWLLKKGMHRAAGPLTFSLWQEAGLLVEGFDSPPAVLMGHARRYYQNHMVARGYETAHDLLAYDYRHATAMVPGMARIVERTRADPRFRFRNIRMDKQHFASEIALILDILNDAWSTNWGFIPMTQAEIDDLAGILRLVLPPEAVFIGEYDGEPVAFNLTLPNLNEAIRDLRGRLFPFGAAKLLWRLKISGIRTGRMALMGVRRKLQNSTAGAGLALTIIQLTRESQFARKVTSAELSWVLDSNERLKHLLTLIDATVYKRYRIYQKNLVANASQTRIDLGRTDRI